MTCGTTTGCTNNCTQGRYCPGHGKKPAPAWLTPVIAIGMIIMLSYVGPRIDNNSQEFSQADEAIAQQKHENHIARAGTKVCGANAAWQIEGNTLQCFTHKGRKTSVTAQVAR